MLHRPERYRTDAALPSGIGPELLEPADPLWRLVLPAAVVCVRALSQSTIVHVKIRNARKPNSKSDVLNLIYGSYKG